MSTKLVLIMVACLLSACASLRARVDQNRRNFQIVNCNYDAAFEWGATDASHRMMMDSNRLAAYCPFHSRRDVVLGYRDGYTSVRQPAVIIVKPGTQSKL